MLHGWLPGQGSNGRARKVQTPAEVEEQNEEIARKFFKELDSGNFDAVYEIKSSFFL
jgi:hypothetical protein